MKEQRRMARGRAEWAGARRLLQEEERMTSLLNRQREEMTHGRQLYASRVERTWRPVDNAGARWRQRSSSCGTRATPASGRRLSDA
jgi:hypothetical protein